MKIKIISPLIGEPKSNTILNYNTQTNQPEYTDIEEPTLSVLIHAFENGNYELMPDPEPVPEIPTPNWQGFGGTIAQNNLYDKYKNDGDFQTIISLISVFAAVDTPGMYPAFSLIWSKFIANNTLLTQEINDINSACLAFYLPFILNENGEIIF